jgi:antibiotic biosynthesis monooxygenase (ABM) superfamily enzyme
MGRNCPNYLLQFLNVLMLQHEGNTMEFDGKPSEADQNDGRFPRSPKPASIHVRALLTWLVIFPLVAFGMTASSTFVEDWHPAVRALTLTLVVVPTTVYIGVPWLLKFYSRIIHIRYVRQLRRAAVFQQRRAE